MRALESRCTVTLAEIITRYDEHSMTLSLSLSLSIQYSKLLNEAKWQTTAPCLLDSLAISGKHCGNGCEKKRARLGTRRTAAYDMK